MDTEAQIQHLLTSAAPLRLLSDDDPEKVALTGIVDKINALRAIQASEAAPVAESAQSFEDERSEGKAKIALTKEAKSLGIAVDGRWSVKRIQDEIDIVRNSHDTIVDGLPEGADAR